MSKFTEGKWEYDDYGGHVWGAEHRMIVAQMRGTSYLCGTLGLKSCKAEEIQNANGRLIAAAPEMYELLKECAGDLEFVSEQTLSDRCRDLLARIDSEDISDA